MFRPTLVWTPDDVTDVTLIIEHGETEGDGAAWSNVTAQRAGVIEDFTTLSDDADVCNPT